MSLWSEVAGIYRSSKKKPDINWWTEWVARPPAALFVYLVKETRITPNQITFLGLLVAVLSAALFVWLPGYAGAIVAAVIFELSFVLDCADGQLARMRKLASPLGHQLDFVIDEVKAFVLFGAITLRLYRFAAGDEALTYLIVGVVGMACLGAGLSMTTFIRLPEYAGAKTKAEKTGAGPADLGPLAHAVALLEWAARSVVHYPSYLLIVALIPDGRLDIYFWAYAGVNALYAGRTLLQIMLKLGRFVSQER